MTTNWSGIEKNFTKSFVYCYYFIAMQVAVHGCSAMLLSLLQPPSSVHYNEVNDLTILLNHHELHCSMLLFTVIFLS